MEKVCKKSVEKIRPGSEDLGVESPFVFEKKVPESDSAVLVGIPPCPEVWDLLRRCTRVLWIRAGNGGGGPGGRLAPDAVQVLDAGRPDRGGQRGVVELFFEKNLKHLPSLFVCRGVEREPLYEAVLALVYEVSESAFRMRMTRQRDAFQWQEHCIRNALDYVKRRVPPAWEGCLLGRRGFVVGAGPSLEASMDTLVRVRNAGIVFAADSAWSVLRERGIEPDFVVSIDAAKRAGKCVPSDGVRGERVVLSLVSPPDWREAVGGGNRFYVSSNQLTGKWLQKNGVAPPPVSVRENCGATALEMARFLGCGALYVFGMDLALGSAGGARRHHRGVDASLYQESGFSERQQFPKVPGNFSEAVFTHVIGDWRELDARLARWPADLVRVVSDRGARFSNTRVIHPERLPDVEPELFGELPLSTLSGLEPPVPGETEAVERAFLRLGALLGRFVPELRGILRERGPGDAARALARVFQTGEGDAGLMLGAFSLKWMPQILPPVMQGAVGWEELIGELSVLGERMREVAGAD